MQKQLNKFKALLARKVGGNVTLGEKKQKLTD